MKKLFSLLIITFCTLTLGASLAKSREMDKSKLTSFLAGSNAGNEFYFSFPACYDEESPGSDNYLRVFVASGVRQEITVEVESQGWRESKIAVANDVVEFKIPTTVGQPFYKRGRDKAPKEQVYFKAAVHIKARAPIICYGVTRYQYTSDGFLAIPISAFGNEYVIASYPQYTAAGFGYFLPAESNIIAAYDDTEVTFTMGGTAGSMTTGGLKKGQKATFNMMKGDVLCFANDADAQDIAGSLVKATKPIGVVSGNQCANVPSGVYACDYISEMELPTFTWGKEYHVTPIVGRLKAPIIRIFAKERDTKVLRDGQDWMRITLNSRGEGDAFIERRAFDGLLADVVNTGGTPCKVISADKPIYIMLYNTGQSDDNVTSDPFAMVMTPLEQYQKEIVFCTPGAKGGSLPFLRQYVNLVYENAPDGSVPDDLEFASVVNGKFSWKKVNVQFGASPGYKFSIPIRGKTYSMKRLQLNGDGVYRIRAKAPFAGYAYGFSWYDSYGFPTSVALGDLEKKDTVKPDPQWKVLCDGSVVGADGSGSAIVTDKPDDPNLRSNLALIYMDLDSSYNYDFNYDKKREFIAGTTITTDWSLNVIDPALDARAMLIFVDRAGNDTIIEVNYKAFSVDVIAKETDFGLLKPGQKKTKQIDLVNLNKNSEAIVKGFRLKNGSTGFTLQNITFPLTIPAGGKVTLDVEFTKDVIGEFNDVFLIDDGCVIAEKGIVKAKVGEPIIYVSEIDFGAIKKGTTSILPLAVRNEGTVPLTITGYSMPTQPTIFKPMNWPAVSTNNPWILAVGETKQLDVEFSALDKIQYADQIVFSSDASSRDSIGELRGRGVEGGLIARGYDWQRRRTNAGPYVSDSGIYLKNIGNANVTIRQATALNPAAAYSYDNNFANQLTLKPDEEGWYPAAFSPAIPGGDTLIIRFETIDGTFTETEPPLRGAGIVGHLATQNYDFDTTFVQGIVKPVNKKTVIIENVGTKVNGADFSDNVLIDSIIITNAGTIADKITGNVYGTSGFRFDYSAMKLPVTLKPGERLSIPAEFQAQKPGIVMESISTQSDADNVVQSDWTGFGVDPFKPDPRIVLVGGKVDNICIGSQGIILASVQNTGNVKFPILNAFIEPASQEFVLDPNSLTALKATSLDLAETRPISILFSPLAPVGVKTATLALIGPTDQDTTRVIVTGTAVDYSYTVVTKGATGVKIGSSTDIVLSLQTAPDANANLQSMTFVVDFDSKVFSPVVNNIKTSGTYAGAGYSIGNASIVSPGKLKFDVIALNTKIDKSGDIVTIPMNVYLPVDGKKEFDVISEITTSNPCVTIKPIPGKIEIDPTCAYSLRGVDSKGQAFSLQSVSPNPIVNGMGELVFSVGFKVQTEISLYTMTGERVAIINDGVLEAGVYTAQVPFANIPSGSYVVKMVAGPYIDQQQISVTK